MVSVLVPAFVLTASSAHAAALTDSQIQSILSLLQSFGADQTAVNNVNTALHGQSTAGSIAGGNIPALLITLRQGATGDDVRVIQALLAADPDVYPQGLITGIYGPLTTAAVKRFQNKHSLEQVGHVGPKTLKELNKLLNENPITFESSTSTENRNNDDKRPCAIVPPGHLIAPGWLRKNNGVTPIVPLCQTLPPGILQKLSGTTTPPTTDTAAPIMTGLIATTISTTTATITWDTDENAIGTLRYGTTTPVLSDILSQTSMESISSTTHSFALSGLVASTTHYYVAVSADAAGNTATSSEQSFITLSE